MCRCDRGGRRAMTATRELLISTAGCRSPSVRAVGGARASRERTGHSHGYPSAWRAHMALAVGAGTGMGEADGEGTCSQTRMSRKREIISWSPESMPVHGPT